MNKPRFSIAALLGHLVHSAFVEAKPATDRQARKGLGRRSKPIGPYQWFEPLEPRVLLSSYVVINTLDSGPGSLRAAVIAADNATSPTTITFNTTVFPSSGPMKTITLTNGVLDLNNDGYNITIIGPGAAYLAISGNNTGGVIQVDGGVPSTISGLTITDGNTLPSSSGGGIANSGTLTLANCIVTNNTAYEGGAFDNVGTMFVDNSILSHNSAAFGGGILNGGTLNLSGTTMLDNNSTEQGGIYNLGSLNVNNSTFSGNTASTNGGALVEQVGATFLTITSSTFTGNTAAVAGAVDLESTNQATFINDVFSDNSTTIGAGALYIGPAVPVTILGSTFTGNSIQGLESGAGGAVFANTGSTLAISNSTFSNNSSLANGGGIYNQGSAITVANSTFSGNTAATSGGALMNAAAGTLTIWDSTFSANSATVYGGAIMNNTGDGPGDTITVTNSTLYGNMAGSGGGGIFLAGGTLLNNTIVASSTNGDAVGPGALDPASSHNLIGDGAYGLTNGVNGNILGTIPLPVNPKLGPLAINGGTTKTFALLAGSPAINTGSNALAVDGNSNPLLIDQRGDSRIVGGTVDIGAYEYNSNPRATQLVILSQPSGTTAGININPVVTVAVEDPLGNIVPISRDLITLSILCGPTGGKIGGIATASVSKGIATFPVLYFDTAGNYQLTASDGVYTSTTSNSFTISPAAAVRLVVVQHPTTVAPGNIISPFLVVDVEDAFGNVITTDNSYLNISISSGPTGGYLEGLTTEQATAGVATFAFAFDQAGTYTIKVTDGNLTADSFAIKVTAPPI